MHGKERDYTFFSQPQQSYSQIDLFLVNKITLQHISKVEIGPIAWTNHAPISLEIFSSQSNRNTSVWRLNSSLLINPRYKDQIKRGLTYLFQINNTEEVNMFILWNVHQAVMRGLLIKMGVYEKRRRTKEISDLLHQIQTLEKKRKSSLDTNDAKALQDLWQTLAGCLLTLRA